MEEEFEVEESETKSTPRPASKLDLEEPLPPNDDGEEEDDEGVILKSFKDNFQFFQI